jgi:quercetin dioxygenase-like cupin family protein
MSENYYYLADLATQLPEIPPDTIVSRTFYSDPLGKVILFGFAAGQELSEHTASRPAVLHFLQGEAHLSLGKDEFEARPGTWVHMPPNMPHSVLAKTPLLMLLIMFENG